MASFRELYLHHWDLARACDKAGDEAGAKAHYLESEKYYTFLNSGQPDRPQADEPDNETPSAFEVEMWRAENLRFIPQADAYRQRCEDDACRGGEHD